jgi:hypothetical protein
MRLGVETSVINVRPGQVKLQSHPARVGGGPAVHLEPMRARQRQI